MTANEIAEALEYLADTVEEEWGEDFKYLDEAREAIEQLRGETREAVLVLDEPMEWQSPGIREAMNDG